MLDALDSQLSLNEATSAAKSAADLSASAPGALSLADGITAESTGSSTWLTDPSVATETSPSQALPKPATSTATVLATPNTTTPMATTAAPAVAPTPAPTKPATAPPPPTGSELDQAEAASLVLLNQLRNSLGLSTLAATDPAMSSFARNWSRDMSQNGFRHSSSRPAKSENIVWYSNQNMTPQEAAERFHDMWVNSPGHYKNMTTARWTLVGVGMYKDDSGWWGTHVFRTGDAPAPTATTVTTAPPTNAAPAPSGNDVQQAEAASLVLLNQLRTSLGLSTLTANDGEMSSFARNWSLNMRQNGFRHSSGRWSENIVWWSNGNMTPQQAAEKFHDMWINSPGHYRNITTPNWTVAGIGFYKDESGWWPTHLFR